jgi:hypothetical protein
VKNKFLVRATLAAQFRGGRAGVNLRKKPEKQGESEMFKDGRMSRQVCFQIDFEELMPT